MWQRPQSASRSPGQVISRPQSATVRYASHTPSPVPMSPQLPSFHAGYGANDGATEVVAQARESRHYFR